LNPRSISTQTDSQFIQSIIHEILTTIPALAPDQIAILADYLYNLPTKGELRYLRTDIAEIAYRNRPDPQALDIYLASTIPIARRISENKAFRIYACPTDWILECMYDGAFKALMSLFNEEHRTIRPGFRSFRHLLMRTIVYGTTRHFRARHENTKISTVEDISLLSTRQQLFSNPVENDVLTRKVLEQVLSFPHLTDRQRALLNTIGALGPDNALRQFAPNKKGKGDPAKWKQNLHSRPLLDSQAIAATMGIRTTSLEVLLRETRRILRDVFNRDGNLFSH
jgi:hypothetical protein